MKLFTLFWALALIAFLAGCAPVDSLNPLYAEQDIVFDSALLGQWGTENEGLNFARLGDNGYSMVWSGRNEETGQPVTTALEAHLVSLQGRRFLDVVWKQSGPAGEPEEIPEVHLTRTKNGMKIEPRLVPSGMGAYWEFLPGESFGDEDRLRMRPLQTHQVFKVIVEDEGKTLHLIQLDDSWLMRQIREGKLTIDHEMIGERGAVLTASTHDLQQLVLDYVDDEDAFTGDTTMRRPDHTDSLQ